MKPHQHRFPEPPVRVEDYSVARRVFSVVWVVALAVLAGLFGFMIPATFSGY